ILARSKQIEGSEAPQSAGAETAAPGGRLAVGPVPSSEGTAGPSRGPARLAALHHGVCEALPHSLSGRAFLPGLLTCSPGGPADSLHTGHLVPIGRGPGRTGSPAGWSRTRRHTVPASAQRQPPGWCPSTNRIRSYLVGILVVSTHPPSRCALRRASHAGAATPSLRRSLPFARAASRRRERRRLPS